MITSGTAVVRVTCFDSRVSPEAKPGPKGRPISGGIQGPEGPCSLRHLATCNALTFQNPRKKRLISCNLARRTTAGAKAQLILLALSARLDRKSTRLNSSHLGI